LRILFAADVEPDPNSGAAGTEWQTIQALRQLGHEVDELWAADLGRRIRHGNLHYLLELPRAYRRVIGRQCERRDYDVIHANQGHCYLAAQAHRQAGRRGIFICRSHGLDDRAEHVLKPWRDRLGIHKRGRVKAPLGKLLDSLLYRHDRIAYRVCDGIIVSSSGDASYLTDTMAVPADYVACIPQAPAATFVAEVAPMMDNSRLRRILHVGGFSYWKGVHAVAAAANMLFQHDRNIKMTWVCRAAEHDQVKNLLTPAACARVEFMDWRSQQDLLAIYDQHGIYICPSLFEGFGKVFLEAMARGMCVVGTQAGGMPDVIRDGVNGFLVPFHSAEAIVQRGDTLWANPDRASVMSAAAASSARAFSWSRVARETSDFYERLLRLRAGAAAS
jgi:glycosyltransferase involved in cell wall biosynthesis